MIDNNRYKALCFDLVADSVLHGFAGYFECQLYKKIIISILPATHSPGMFSWFPIFFPLKDPVQVKKTDKLKLHFWRNVTKGHVWSVLVSYLNPDLTQSFLPAGTSGL